MSWTDLHDLLKKHEITPRETEIIETLVEGHSNKAIARILDANVGTIKVQVKNILFKMNAMSRTHVASIYYKTLYGIN